MKRKPFVCGNWKLNLSLAQSEELVLAVSQGSPSASLVETVVAPVAPFLAPVCGWAKGSDLKVAAQNVHFEDKGAFTGEWSCAQLKEIGCSHIIIGHSERRANNGDTNKSVSQKVATCLKSSLTPVACLGESLDERKSGKLWDILKAQLEAICEGVSKEELPQLVLAYEPIWAIGTGEVATPAQAEEVHEFLRSTLSRRYGSEKSGTVRIIYGGSVKAGNAKGLFEKNNIDGALVGGASLVVDDFLGILKAAAE